jgi:hypothetical protein
MSDNHEAIYGCGPAELEKPEWGWYTQKGNVVYAHVTNFNIGQICLRGMDGKIESATLLADGTEIRMGEISNVNTNGPYVGKNDVFLAPLLPRTGTPPPADASSIKVAKLILRK